MATNYPKPLPPLTPEDIANFWSKVEVRGPDECWPWRAGYFSNGYGAMHIRGRRPPVKAHRVAYFLHHGEDPHPLNGLHSCDNPPCCNGAHIFKGTMGDNVQDMVKKGRHIYGEAWHAIPRNVARGDRNGARTHPGIRAGTRNGAAKFTELDIISIRQRRADGESAKSISKSYGVWPTTIHDIVRRTTWASVP